MLTEHKRVKHGQLPGDIPKKTKIRLREKGHAVVAFSREYVQVLNRNAGKVFRRVLIDRGRTLQRRRDKKAISAELDSME